MKPYKDCKYAAFVSYAHADDEYWDSWISDFAKELTTSLSSGLRGLYEPKKPPSVHLSAENGPVGGSLSGALKERIADSYAMIIVVHENYARSNWCLKELEYFKSLFSAEGFLNRLYIIAISQEWILSVEQMPSWRVICPNPDQIWMPFFREHETGKPLDIYEGKRLTTEFKKQFERLREDLIQKIREDAKNTAQTSVFTASGTGATAPAAIPDYSQEGVRIYIESNQHELELWESLGKQIKKKWDNILNECRPPISPPLYIRPRGLPVDHIDRYPRLDDADGVVLLWGRKQLDSLIAQINKVEGKLCGRDLAPGIVAYLMPPQAKTEEPVPAHVWKVLRFDAQSENDIDIVPQEADQLQIFLKEILNRTTERRKAAANGG